MVSQRRKTEGTGNSHEERTSARKIAIAACKLSSQPCSRESERCSSQSELSVAVSAAKVAGATISSRELAVRCQRKPCSRDR
jgi:hypothetical protein